AENGDWRELSELAAVAPREQCVRAILDQDAPMLSTKSGDALDRGLREPKIVDGENNARTIKQVLFEILFIDRQFVSETIESDIDPRVDGCLNLHPAMQSWLPNPRPGIKPKATA